MIGTRLSAYEVLSELGSGGMGSVYLAECTDDTAGLDKGVRVALKVIHPNLLSQPGFFKRFLREAQIGQDVRHENVVRCFDCDATLVDGTQHNYLVMEYVEGQTLRELLVELDRVPEELCRHIGREIAKGLAAIHEAGVVHRDIKPENVLITEDHIVKVMDLGVARLSAEAIRLSQTGAFVGSLEYAAPEQFKTADGQPDGRADLHSLGVLLYELSTGQHPYRDEDASKVLRNILDVDPRKAGEVNPQLSPFFEEVIHKLIAKDREQRFDAAADLALVLDQGEKSDWWRERAKELRLQTKRPLRRIRIPRETALYGRGDDLAKLQALFDKAKEGDGQVLLIEGEAGIGKTRLVDEFVGRLRQAGEDVNFVFGSYPPGGAATASGAFSEAYREQFGAEGLEETLAEYIKPTPILIPAFAAVLKGETTPKDAGALTKDSLQTVFVHATRGLAAERTTIVLIDDLHFAPEDGRALFSSLAMAVPGHRVLLLGTMRPGVAEDWTANVTRLDHAEHRPLSRLGPKDLSALLKDAFRSERLARELALQISEKSDGNPFFTFEIIRGLREGQFISQKPDGTWVTTKVIQDIQVPSSVLDLVNARVADLTEEERDLLDVASCCGFTFDPLLVGQVVGVGRIPVLKRLAQIERRRRLVRASGSTYVFDHHQVQEALYGSLADPLKQEYHAVIAHALADRAGAADKDPKDLDGALCVDLCAHYMRGAQGDKALPYLDAALDHLERGFLNHQAIALADRALAAPGLLQGGGRLEVLLRKNDRLDLLGRPEAQEEVLSEARSLGEKEEGQTSLARIERAVGVLLLGTGRHEEAREHFERCLAIAHEVGDQRGEARATGNLGSVYYCLGHYEEAEAHHKRDLAIAREIGDQRGEAIATGNLGNVYDALGHYEEAKVHHERNLAIAREIGDQRGEATATGHLGLVFSSLGRYEEAKAHHERSLRIAREIGYQRGEANATGNLGNVCYHLGRYHESKAQYERHLTIAREIGDQRGEAAATGNLGLVLTCQSRYEEAQEHFERHLTIAREIGDQRGEANATGNLGNVYSHLGHYEEAKAQYERQLTIVREIGDQLGEAIATGNLGIVYYFLGRYEEAKAQYERHLTITREIGYRQGEALALDNLGSLFLTLGVVDRARQALEDSRALSRKIGTRYGEGCALSSLAAVAQQEGGGGGALDLAHEALALRREISDNGGVADSLVQVGELHRRSGDDDASREALQEAVDLLRQQHRKGELAQSLAFLACLPGGDAEAAEATLKEADESGCTPQTRFYLWKATGKPEHLVEAKRLLDYRVEHAPEEYRESMLKNVRINREIMEAWEAQAEAKP